MIKNSFELFYNKNTNSESNIRNLTTNIEPDELALYFFSDKNINYINNQLVERIRKLSIEILNKPLVIQHQKKHILLKIIRYFYLKKTFTSKIVCNKTLNERVKLLNNIIIEYCVPKMFNGLISYLKYLNKVEENKNINLNLDVQFPENTRVSNRIITKEIINMNDENFFKNFNELDTRENDDEENTDFNLQGLSKNFSR